MNHNIDLVGYLPPFLAEYNEISAALNAENPEFSLLWDAAERVLHNEFIETADEYGISRFEKLLGILPSNTENLDSRRSRVMSRWFNATPYTLKSLIAKLIILCGENNFSIVKNYDYYQIRIETHLDLFGQVDELKRIILSMIPCNMIACSFNNIICSSDCYPRIAGAVSSTEFFFITNDFNQNITSSGGASASAVTAAQIVGA